MLLIGLDPRRVWGNAAHPCIADRDAIPHHFRERRCDFRLGASGRHHVSSDRPFDGLHSRQSFGICSIAANLFDRD